MIVADRTGAVYSERLFPSPAAWLLAVGVGAVFFIMLFPVGTTVAYVVAGVTGAGTVLWLWSLAAKLQVTPTHLIVGRARIEIESLGPAHVCSATEMREHMGPGSDARSFVLTRPWVRTGVHIEQTDPRDPTPYWLFSSRHAAELVSAIEAQRQR